MNEAARRCDSVAVIAENALKVESVHYPSGFEESVVSTKDEL